MTKSPRSIEPHQSIDVARRWMDDMKVRHLPVRSGGKVVGVLSDRDINLLTGIAGGAHSKSMVEDAMISSVRTVSASMKLKDVAKEMLEHRIGCVLVTGKDETLLGIFTDTDALAVLAEMSS
jgi:acetoin utilization protein AcuB